MKQFKIIKKRQVGKNLNLSVITICDLKIKILAMKVKKLHCKEKNSVLVVKKLNSFLQ